MSRDKVQRPLEGIEELEGRLAAWRQERVSGEAMPQELWSAAAELARRHSVFAVSRRLGLEFNKLKAHVEGRAPAPKKRGPSRRSEAPSRRPEVSGFVELDATELFGPSSGETEAVLEMMAPDGARMRISLRGRTALDLAGVVAAFSRRR